MREVAIRVLSDVEFKAGVGQKAERWTHLGLPGTFLGLALKVL